MFAPKFVDTRVQLHWLAQIPSAAGKLHGKPDPLWRHTALRWDDAHDALVLDAGVRVGIRLDGCLLVEDEVWNAEGRTLADARLWMEHELAERGLKGNIELRDPASMPEHGVAKGEPFDFDGLAANQVRDLFHHGHAALQAWSDQIGASDVYVWAHHFDIAVLEVLARGKRDDLEDGVTVGYGMSPGDGTSDDPYGYVTFWPTPESTPELPALPHGRWNTQGWLGTVLPASDNDGRDTLWSWLKASRGAARSLLVAPQV